MTTSKRVAQIAREQIKNKSGSKESHIVSKSVLSQVKSTKKKRKSGPRGGKYS